MTLTYPPGFEPQARAAANVYPHQQPQAFAYDPYGEQSFGAIGEERHFAQQAAALPAMQSPVSPPVLLTVEHYVSPNETYPEGATFNFEVPSVSRTEALATWYAEYVVDVLIYPGFYSGGVSGTGSDSKIWGKTGRVKDSLERVGVHLPDDMWETAAARGHTYNTTSPADPWSVAWKNWRKVSPRLVLGIKELIKRMHFTPAVIVAATWYLRRLGLHECDPKGAKLRHLLSKTAKDDMEAVELRVAILGLNFASKWLDDNSYLTKSWNEVTHIPCAEMHALELAALEDMHFSVWLSAEHFIDHATICLQRISLRGGSKSLANRTMMSIIEDLRDFYFTKVNPSSYLPTRACSVDNEYLSQLAGAPVLDSTASADLDMDAVANLVNEDGDVYEDDDEDEEEYLEYDGAKRWLPTRSEMRRSLSNSAPPVTVDPMANLMAWRTSVSQVEAYLSPYLLHTPEEPRCTTGHQPAPPAYSGRARAGTPPITYLADVEPVADVQVQGEISPIYEIVPDSGSEQYTPDAAPISQLASPEVAQPAAHEFTRFKETGVRYEPGIVQVRPGTACGERTARRLIPLDPRTLQPLDPNVNLDSDLALPSGAVPSYAETRLPARVRYPYHCSYERGDGYLNGHPGVY